MNLNPFKKKGDAEKKKREADWAVDEQRVEALVKAAEAVTDPAEKIIALRQIGDALNDMIRAEQRAISKEAAKKGSRAGSFVSSPIEGAGLAALVALHGPIAWAGLAIFFGGDIAGDIVKHARRKSVSERLAQDAKSHILYLAGKGVAVRLLMEETVAAHVPEISKSPLHGEIMKDISLARVFADAAAKHVVAQEEEAAALKKAQEAAAAAEETAGRTDTKKKEYKKLVDVLKTPEEKARDSAKKGGPKPGAP
ncbi:MAG: hypothetical protein KGL10_08390 [Alphaproteobacteria bacterium]|nr:hypothetical protein [Alphaproteobacteria bacterium]MDE2337317.1 hypothetical protein [Alphaproteobacteria bacterium]